MKLIVLKKLAGLYIFLCFSFISAPLFAQVPTTGNIKGRIVTPDNKPVSYAEVVVKKLNRKTIADRNGYFELNNLPALTDTIVVTAIGINTYRQPVSLAEGETINLAELQATYNNASLPDVEITGRVAQSYKSDYTFSTTKTQTALKDIPQSVSTVTKELIQDKMQWQLKDAVDDVAGVNMYSGYDEYSIRGFRADNAHLINGLRAYNTTLTSPMLVNIERIEVIKGPASVLYGNGDPGGTINMVTKKPMEEGSYNINLFTGSFNAFRAMCDATGPISQNKKLLYRFNAGYENANSFRSQYFAKSFQLAPSISYIPNDRVKLNADFSISNTNTIADRGQPGLLNNNNLLSTPINLIVTQPGDYLKETDITSIISFAYKFNNHITFNSAVLNHLTWQKLAEHGIKDYITPDSVNLYYAQRAFNTNTTTLTNYAAFNFNTGLFKHQLIAGYDYIKSSITLDESAGELPDVFGDGSGIVGTFSLKRPQYFKRPLSSYEMEKDEDEGDAPEAYSTQGAYIQEQVTFKNWLLLMGLRGESYSKEDDNDSAGESEENVLLPRIGLVYKANANLSLYATYNKGFDPFEASITTQVFNEPFKPIYSEVYEAGAKATLFKNKLYATFAIYSLTLKNVAVNANDPSAPDLFVQRGKEQAKGFETEVNGNILPNLSINVSFAHNIAKVIESEIPAEKGTIKENAPRNSSGSWIKYTFNTGFFKGVVLSAGHSQVGIRNTLTPGLTLPAYCIFNTGIGYTYKKIKAALNIYNIANANYWTGGYNYASKWPGAPRNFMLNVGYSFGR